MHVAFISMRYCVTCQGETLFERPECLDDHGIDCPDEVCVECGDAFVVGFSLAEPVPSRGAGRHVA